MKFSSISVAGLALLTFAGSGTRATAATRYVFATFKGDDAAGMKLSVYTSTDSVNFTLLSDTGFGGNTSYLRDPTIMKYSDGRYYIAYTDPTSASCCNPEDHFGIAVSSDLVHWSDLTTVKGGVPGLVHVWAPEWYSERGVVKIVANIDTGQADFEPYVFTAQNSALTSWSGPTALGIGKDYIDTFVARRDGDATYHAFTKNEVTRFLEHATASSLTGPWTFVGRADWAGWGSGLEGPSIVRLDDGRYRMYVDPQQGGASYQYMTSSDLVSWSAKSSVPSPAGPVLRHGTMIRDEIAAGVSGAGGASGMSGTGGGAGSTAAGGRGGDTATRGTGGVSSGSGGAAASSGGVLGGVGGQPGVPNDSGVGGSTSPDGSTSGDGGGAPPGSGGMSGTGGRGSPAGAGGSPPRGDGGLIPAPAPTAGCGCRFPGERSDELAFPSLLFASFFGWWWARARARRLQGLERSS